MKRRGFGLLLVLTLVIAAGTLYQDYRFDTMLAKDRAASTAIDRQFASLDLTLANLRAAQAGYVAAGQGPQFWMARETDLATDLEDSISRLSSSTPLTDARAHYDAAMIALGDLNSVDGRARDDVNNKDSKFEASDLIFVDGLQAAQKLSAEIAAARTVEEHAADARLAQTSWLRFGMNAVALAYALIVALFFVRRASSHAVDAEIAEPTVPSPKLSDLNLRPPSVTTSVPPVTVSPANSVRAGDVNLADAAELCVDLARVIDERDVPALLERAARVLDAKGVVLWLADTTGSILKPSLAHGYGDSVLSRMGTLTTDGDNATALAYRSMRPQVINGATGKTGAIAVPLVTSSGCVGVLAAEMGRTRPATDTLAVSRMIAAQFASLVAPVSEAGAKAAQA
jgi:hypothetical protein